MLENRCFIRFVRPWAPASTGLLRANPKVPATGKNLRGMGSKRVFQTEITLLEGDLRTGFLCRLRVFFRCSKIGMKAGGGHSFRGVCVSAFEPPSGFGQMVGAVFCYRLVTCCHSSLGCRAILCWSACPSQRRLPVEPTWLSSPLQ